MTKINPDANFLTRLEEYKQLPIYERDDSIINMLKMRVYRDKINYFFDAVQQLKYWQAAYDCMEQSIRIGSHRNTISLFVDDLESTNIISHRIIADGVLLLSERVKYDEFLLNKLLTYSQELEQIERAEPQLTITHHLFMLEKGFSIANKV